MTKEIRDKSDVVCNFYQSAEDVPDHRELDDLLLEKQNTYESCYVKAKHSNVDCFYLA